MNYKYRTEKSTLKNGLMKLNRRQLKLFYTIFVHYWADYKFFISKQNFFNLWCELNELCHEFDEGFPEPHNDHDLIKSYCFAHPYYFIDILPRVMVIKLFCQHFDDRLDILAMIANKLATESLWAAYESSNEALGLSENISESVADAEKYLNIHS